MIWHPVMLVKLIIVSEIFTPDPITKQKLHTYILGVGQMPTTIPLPPIANDP